MSQTSLTVAQRVVPEEASFQYTGYIKDETGTVIPLASLTTLTLTLYNKATGAIINSRNAQNVKNANNVTVHATSGLVTWSAKPADNPIIDTTLDAGETEEHVALFEWTYNSGADGGKHELSIYVRQLTKVT